MAKVTLFVRDVRTDKAGHKYAVTTDIDNKQSHLAYENRGDFNCVGKYLGEDLKGKVVVANCTLHAMPATANNPDGSVKLIIRDLVLTNEVYNG